MKTCARSSGTLPTDRTTGQPGAFNPGRKDRIMKHKRTYIWAYLDGKKLVEVIQAALDNNMMVDDMKKLLIAENPGHEVTFKIVKR